MEGPPVPPAVPPRPPDEEDVAPPRERRLRTWLVVVTVIALAAAGAAGYAISEIESTKDQNREDDKAVSELRADLDVVREQLGGRVDAIDKRVDQAADVRDQRKLRDALDALDKRVTKLDQQGGGDQDLSTRVDDLEKRVEDLENKKNP